MEITAYHGTPHTIGPEGFSSSRIGSGEGAAMYGHGLYFADSPQVASAYRASTSDGFGLDDGPTRGIATLIAARGDDGEKLARAAYADLGEQLEPTIDSAKRAVSENSNLYTVDIPDEAVAGMLQWDRPLSEQPKGVQSAIQRLMPTVSDDGMVGRDFYYKIAADEAARRGADPEALAYNQRFASEALRAAGVPGIRYQDAGSRRKGAADGGPTYNTVVFDDRLIKVLERNGQRVDP